ncbi:MAG: FAD-dependent oxidoreductase [Chitinivibrionales bacterium]|nr:FAD-dependent oxidoreductase [Chitinivibrionales bacterium]
MQYYEEPVRRVPVREFDVVVAGGGTGGVVAALAAARRGARTCIVESKGYFGGLVVEGGTALHSFFNLWKAFAGVEKRQVVKGIPQQIIDRLAAKGGTTGHAEMTEGYGYDSVCTAVDTELYKLTAFEMLDEAGVTCLVNTFLNDAIVDDGMVRGVIVQSRSGREALMASSFIDCTGYGDLAAAAGAAFTEPNDHPVANSMGVGGVDIEKYHEFLRAHGALSQYSEGLRGGREGRIVRLDADMKRLPEAFRDEARSIGFSPVTTSTHDGYFMFIKLNHKMPQSPTSRDAVAEAELLLRQRQAKAIELLRTHVPGCERAFIARTSPSVCIRRGRRIECDYDLSLDEILEGRHFDDDIMAYGFHDCAPRLQIANGGTYGIPYRALLPRGIDNLYATGMMITSDWEAHMSTRNTVSCMGQGQAAGTAAALCAQRGCSSRDLPYAQLREALLEDGVVLEATRDG